MAQTDNSTSLQDVAAVLTDQRNAALNQVAELAIQLRQTQRRIAELERQIGKVAEPKAVAKKDNG